MIDNLELIKPLLKWDEDTQFYFIQLIARKKDIEGMQGNSRVVKDYYIYSLEQLEKRYDEIKKLCKQFKARAYIRLSRRDAAEIAKDLIVLIGESFRNNNFQHLRKIYSTAVGQSLGLDKYWIIDLDGEAASGVDRIIEAINVLQPKDVTNKVVATLPTPNGVHLITTPFDLMRFQDNGFQNIDVHKNNPTILYSI